MRNKDNIKKRNLIEQFIRSMYHDILDIKFKTSNDNLVVNVVFNSQSKYFKEDDDIFMDSKISEDIMTFTGIKTSPIWDNYSFTKKLSDLYVNVRYEKPDEINENVKPKVNVKEIISYLLDSTIMKDYDNICDYEFKDFETNRGDNVGLVIYFNGDVKTYEDVLFYNGILDKIWRIIYNFTGITVAVYRNYDKNKCK
jgi:hypothetical protein